MTISKEDWEDRIGAIQMTIDYLERIAPNAATFEEVYAEINDYPTDGIHLDEDKAFEVYIEREEIMKYMFEHAREEDVELNNMNTETIKEVVRKSFDEEVRRNTTHYKMYLEYLSYDINAPVEAGWSKDGFICYRHTLSI